jgi:hypothetical protein
MPGLNRSRNTLGTGEYRIENETERDKNRGCVEAVC